MWFKSCWLSVIEFSSAFDEMILGWLMKIIVTWLAKLPNLTQKWWSNLQIFWVMYWLPDFKGKGQGQGQGKKKCLYNWSSPSDPSIIFGIGVLKCHEYSILLVKVMVRSRLTLKIKWILKVIDTYWLTVPNFSQWYCRSKQICLRRNWQS